jgi:hypothetical protein
MSERTRVATSRCLTEEQVMRLLERAVPGAIPSGADYLVQQHLDGCEACRAEILELRSALGVYREAATSFAAAAYGESRSLRQVPFPDHTGWRPMLVWPLTLAAAACACGLAVQMTHHPAVRAVSTVAAVQAGSSAGSDSDERLLEGIDQDLSAAVPPSLAPLSPTAAESGKTGLSQN